LGNQDHGNQLLKYYCSKCDTLLKETNMDIGLSNSKEECPRCGSLVSETLRKEKKREHEPTTNINSPHPYQKYKLPMKNLAVDLLLISGR
jgi:hypothetical protein